MNERMIELYKEASDFAYKICKDEGRSGGPTDHIWNTLSTGMFAELIVAECMRMCDVAAIGYESHNHFKEANGCYSAKEYIEEHFGVE